MSLYVNTNVASLHSLNTFAKNSSQLDSSQEKLGSGLRINSAKDDCAGLQIASHITTQINGLDRANRNANDALAVIQIMDSGSEEIGECLQKMRTLAIQAANGTNTQKDRDAIQEQMKELAGSIFQSCKSTTYGGKTLLAGERAPDANGVNPGLGEKDGSPRDGAENCQSKRDAPICRKTRLTFQIGANSQDTLQIEVGSFMLSSLAAKGGYKQVKDNGDLLDGCGLLHPTPGSIAYPDVSSQETAQKAIQLIDAAISALGEERGYMGSMMNRLESSIRNQSNVSENQSDSRSRLTDTDFAAETALMTQKSIMQQASTSIMTQANSRPELAISLLQR